MFTQKRSYLPAATGALMALLVVTAWWMNPRAKASGRDRAPSPTFYDIDDEYKVSIVVNADYSFHCRGAMLKDQLCKAITGLSSEQSFAITFLNGKGYNQLSEELLPASPDAKRRAGRFLEEAIITPEVDPMPGLEAAFKQHPDILYLIDGGGFADNDAVMQKIRLLNKAKKVKVYTIAFVTSADLESDFINYLKKIAAENRGRFRLVNEGDL